MKYDFNGDGFTDILWRGADGSIAIWNMNVAGDSGVAGGIVAIDADLTLRGIGDVAGSGTSDMIFQHETGLISTWDFLDNFPTIKNDLIHQTSKEVMAVGDFDGNQHTDLLWYTPPTSMFGGVAGTWTAGSADDRKIPPVGLGDFPKTSLDYKFVGVGDLGGDGKDDMLFRGTGNAGARNFLLQEPTGGQPSNGEIAVKTSFFADPGSDWQVKALADFNGDAKADVLWEHSSGAHSVWLMDGKNVIGGGMVSDPGRDWSIVAVQDYDNNGKSDLMWHSASTGWNCEWLMNSNDVQAFGASIANPGDFWTIMG